MGEESSKQELDLTDQRINDAFCEYWKYEIHRDLNIEYLKIINTAIEYEINEENKKKFFDYGETLKEVITYFESKIKPLCDKLGFKYPWVPLTQEDIALKAKWVLNGD